MAWAGARPVDSVPSTRPPRSSVSKLTSNLAGLPRVHMAGLVIYLMDVCSWKYEAVIQVDIPGGDTVSGLVAS